MPNTAQSRTPGIWISTDLDLGRVDVDAARDDHVALAVAQEHVAVGVLVADVAHRHEIAQRDLAALGVVVVVGEFREMRAAQVDLADLALLHVAALLVDDAQRAPSTTLADRARLAQRLLGIVPDHDAGLGGAVVFVDDRPPPVDHLALHGRRAGRGAMRDPAQRGEVVAPLHLVGQAQQAHEHGRHDVHVADLVLIDQPQHVLGLEARLQHDVEAKPGAAHAVGRRRGVIHRAVHQHDDRRIGREAPSSAPLRPRRRPAARATRAGGARPWAGRSCPRCRSCCRAPALGGWALGALRATKASQVSTPRAPGASRPARCRPAAISSGVGTASTFTPAGMPGRSGPAGRCAPPAPWRRSRPGCSPPPPA